MIEFLPLVFFPSTVVWVDDDPLLLEMGKRCLSKDYRIESFTSPRACLNAMEHRVSVFQRYPLLSSDTEHDNYYSAAHAPFDLNIADLMLLAQEPNRHSEVSVCIVDYQMNEMDGLAFCHQLTLPSKRILLTGRASEKNIIDAFNQGAISKFIEKNDMSLAETIHDQVKQLSLAFFCQQTYPALCALEAEKKFAVSDPAFIDYFLTWVAKNAIAEYYLSDKYGSFVTYTKSGKKCYFVVHTDASLNDFIEINEQEPDVQGFIEEVRARRRIPFFGTKQESWQIPATQWEPYFYPATALIGREKYYIAVVVATV